ncbi:MAG: DUF6198 family protein [Erysipelotrichaceae bacterium]|nr:DUF6198 family protein [Erysipelotrichaceae bacterium]
MKNYKQLVAMLILVACNGAACALSMKAAVGVGAWDAVAQLTSNITGIQAGTCGFVFNSLCVLGELIILRKNFKINNFLQLVVSFLFGYVVNFVLYTVLVFEINSYVIRIICLALAYVLMAIFVGGLMELNIVTFALEGFCKELSNVTNIEFTRIRQSVDVICIVLVLLVCILTNQIWTVREGTIIAMLIYSPCLKIAMQYEHKIFKQVGLID